MSFRYDAHMYAPGRATATEDGDTRRNVHLNVPTSLALENHLAVKAVLLNDPELRDEYSAVRLDLATREYNSIGYPWLGKSDFLERILVKVNFTDGDFEEIARVNADATIVT